MNHFDTMLDLSTMSKFTLTRPSYSESLHSHDHCCCMFDYIKTYKIPVTFLLKFNFHGTLQTPNCLDGCVVICIEMSLHSQLSYPMFQDLCLEIALINIVMGIKFPSAPVSTLNVTFDFIPLLLEHLHTQVWSVYICIFIALKWTCHDKIMNSTWSAKSSIETFWSLSYPMNFFPFVAFTLLWSWATWLTFIITTLYTLTWNGCPYCTSDMLSQMQDNCLYYGFSPQYLHDLITLFEWSLLLCFFNLSLPL